MSPGPVIARTAAAVSAGIAFGSAWRSRSASPRDGDRHGEGAAGQHGPAAGLGPARAQEGAHGERYKAADDRDPHDPAGPSLLHAVCELAVDEELRGQPGAEGERDAGQAGAPGEHERPGEREGERKEGREATRLRDGEDVREQREELRHEQDGEPEERAAENELRPAPARGEARERDRQEAGDDDRAAARDRLGREAEGVAEGVERVSVVLDLEGAARCRRPRGRVVRDEGEEPGEIEHERDGHTGERENASLDERVERPDDDHTGDEEAAEEHGHVGRVARMDDRERERRPCQGPDERPRAALDEREGEREHRRREQDAARRGRRGEQLEDPGARTAACPRERELGHLGDDERRAACGPPEDGRPGPVRQENGEGHEDRGQVERDIDDIRAGDSRDQRHRPMPEGERVAGVEAPSWNSLTEPSTGSASNSASLRMRARWKRQVASDRSRRPPDEAGQRKGGAEHREADPPVGACVDRYLLAPRAQPGTGRERRSHDDCEDDEPDGERGAHEEDDAEGEQDDHEADGKGRRHRNADRPGQAERPQHEPAGQQEHEERRDGEPQGEADAFGRQEARDPEREQRSPGHQDRQGQARVDSAAGLGDPAG